MLQHAHLKNRKCVLAPNTFLVGQKIPFISFNKSQSKGYHCNFKFNYYDFLLKFNY